LGTQSHDTGARDLREPRVVCIGGNFEQSLDATAPDRCNDPELGKMRADCIDHCSLLADEQVACAVEHQAALLLGRLGCNKPHVGPGDGLADRFRVSGIILWRLT
jgi:hypothetical protein